MDLTEDIVSWCRNDSAASNCSRSSSAPLLVLAQLGVLRALDHSAGADLDQGAAEGSPSVDTVVPAQLQVRNGKSCCQMVDTSIGCLTMLYAGGCPGAAPWEGGQGACTRCRVPDVCGDIRHRRLR